MVLVRLYSRPLIDATPGDVFYRYAYGSLQVIYLGPSDGERQKGLHLSITVTLCRTGRDYFPRTWCKDCGRDPCRTNPKRHRASHPNLFGRSDACLVHIRIFKYRWRQMLGGGAWVMCHYIWYLGSCGATSCILGHFSRLFSFFLYSFFGNGNVATETV